MVIIEKSINKNAGEKDTLIHCGCKCKLIYPLWKMVSVEVSQKTKNRITI